jgi:transposase-like protein
MQHHQAGTSTAAHERAEAIAQLRGTGVPVVEIARRLGISRQAVYEARSGFQVGTNAGRHGPDMDFAFVPSDPTDPSAMRMLAVPREEEAHEL